MKRDELDFLESEQIDKVMSLYGKAITKKDKEIETLTNSNKELEEKVATYETKINEFNESSKDNADWKLKYEELQTSIKELTEAKIFRTKRLAFAPTTPIASDKKPNIK